MKLIFNALSLNHKHYTGVENYTRYILENIKDDIDIDIIKGIFSNKYLLHLYMHFVLAFKKGDILFSPSNIAPFFIPKTKKSIITIHDVAFISCQDSFSKYFSIYYKWLMPKIIKRADIIITVSNFSKQEIIRYYPYTKDKIKVIYSGLDSKYKVLDNIQREKIILYVGSLNQRKNFISLIKAFFLLKKDDYKLYIVGKFSSNFHIDKYTQDILNKAYKNKNIVFKTNIDDEKLVKLYNQCEVFVYPSFYEGFGFPPLEAMGCENIVIASSIDSIKEVCEDNVIYCNPSDEVDIKDKILQVIDDKDLQIKYRKKALNRAKEFSWEKSAKNHLRVFDI
jgi:glycosyltransferase involved in cell wall biosynthesis